MGADALGLQDADGRSMWTLTWSKAHAISSGLNPGLLAASGLGPPVPPPDSPKEASPPQGSHDPSAQPPPPGPSQQPEDSAPPRRQAEPGQEEASQHPGPSGNAQQRPDAADSQAHSAAPQETFPRSAEASGAQGLPVQQQGQQASMPQPQQQQPQQLQQQQQSHAVPDAGPQPVHSLEPPASGEGGSFSQPPGLQGGPAAQPQPRDDSDGRLLAEPRQAGASGAGLQPQQSMTVEGSLASAAGGSGQYAEVSALALGL